MRHLPLLVSVACTSLLGPAGAAAQPDPHRPLTPPPPPHARPAPPPTYAQPAPPPAPAPHAQPIPPPRARHELYREWRDMKHMEELLVRFDGARARRDRAAQRNIDQEVAVALRTEIDETRRELGQALGEVRKERGEIRADMAAGQHAEAREDKRDLQDAKWDVARERAQLVKLEKLSRDWERIRDRRSSVQVRRKRAILVELLEMAKMEVREDRREMREERRDHDAPRHP